MTLMHRSTRSLCVLILASLVSACGIQSWGTYMSGGGSMRVEVDVYKGPLAKEPAIQLGELVAIVQELERSLTLYDEGLMFATKRHPNHEHGPQGEAAMDTASARQFVEAGVSDTETTASVSNAGTMPPDAAPSWDTVLQYDTSRFKIDEWCSSNAEREDTAWTLYSNTPCIVAAQIHYDTHGLRDHVALLTAKLKPGSENWVQYANCVTVRMPTECADKNVATGRDKLIEALQEIAWLGGRMEVKAQFWTQAHVVLNPGDRLTRGRIVTFINLLSQYSNQLINRSDVLLKQLDSGKDPNHIDPNSKDGLPLSAYLRDTELSDSLNLYVWNRAAAYATFEDTIYHPLEAITSEETTNRVRTAERVFDDQNWHRINEVFASGRGDVNLVLVKDDIGNWTLKSFDSDPAELLATYTNIAKKALQVISENASPNMSAAKKLLQAAASPADSQDGGAVDAQAMITELRSYYIAELQTLVDQTSDNAGQTMDAERSRLEAQQILERYRSALVDVRRLNDAGKLPGGSAAPAPVESPKPL